jgi:hypothetical protein
LRREELDDLSELRGNGGKRAVVLLLACLFDRVYHNFLACECSLFGAIAALAQVVKTFGGVEDIVVDMVKVAQRRAVGLRWFLSNPF